MIIGLFVGIFLVATFVFMTSNAWSLFINAVGTKYGDPDKPNDSYSKLGAFIIFALIITCASIFVVWTVNKNVDKETLLTVSTYL